MDKFFLNATQRALFQIKVRIQSKKNTFARRSPTLFRSFLEVLF